MPARAFKSRVGMFAFRAVNIPSTICHNLGRNGKTPQKVLKHLEILVNYCIFAATSAEKCTYTTLFRTKKCNL